ncbi:hypothetical protein ACQR1W_27165 [Bradyrhizobium sp. HKCCYLS1011]|uniref:hypothetical protein n=1 Tax=Bradyrhizobium sp. HKCCYLS1011 TaxID=3420733 RepID=UPI003EBF86BD
MTRPFLAAAIGAVVISFSAASLASAHDVTAASERARVTKPMRVKHPARDYPRWSYNRLETAPEPVSPPVNLFERGRAPAQPGQW